MRKSLVLMTCVVATLASGCAVSSAPASSADSSAGSGPAASSPTAKPVPGEFRPACGHPGAKVTVLAVPVTITRARCDITGVELTYGLATVTVPAHGRAERQVETLVATTEPTKIVVTVDVTTLDVTVAG